MHPTAGSSRRQDQPRGGDLGKHFVSPVKKRAPKRKKQATQSFVPDAKRAAIQAKLDALEREMERGRQAKAQMEARPAEQPVTLDPEPEPHEQDDHDQAPDMGDDLHIPPTITPKPKRLVPDKTAKKHYTQWSDLLPTLVGPYLAHVGDTLGKAWVRPPDQLSARCARSKNDCSWTTHAVTGLLFGCTCAFLPSCIDSDTFPNIQHPRSTGFWRANANHFPWSSFQMGYSLSPRQPLDVQCL